MNKITVKIDGMMCGMCEAHVNDAIRNNFQIKKVKSSNKKNETVIITEENLTEQQLKEAMAGTGYEVLEVKSEPYEKKGLFS